MMNRRTFLRGAGGIAVALPFLEATSASAEIFPKRFVVFFTPDGPHLGQDCSPEGMCPQSQWAPSGSETDFALSRILQPLEPHRSRILLLEGIDLESAYHGPQDNGHPEGMGHLLCGTELLTTDNYFTGGGISVDQEIANHVGGQTKFRSLELGVQTEPYGSSDAGNRISYSGPGQPVPPDNDPQAAFERIFADVEADPFALARLRARRRSVLDAVAGDLTDLQSQLGAEDRTRLDAHLTAVRELERRLDTISGAGCVVPELAFVDPQAPENFAEVGRLQMDILAMALACDLTRVATLQWSYTGSEVVHTWLGLTETHHAIAHQVHGDEVSAENQAQIHTWYMERFAYFLDKLAGQIEGDATLLDHMVVFRCNELAHCHYHERRNMPFVLAGGCGGYFNTGRYLSYAGAPHNDLLVSFLNAMDIEASTFGNPAYCRGPLDNLT
jgi:hypothetical protein